MKKQYSKQLKKIETDVKSKKDEVQALYQQLKAMNKKSQEPSTKEQVEEIDIKTGMSKQDAEKKKI